MKVLITGIGNIGKSTLREKLAERFSEKIIQIDMDYYGHGDIPESNNNVVLVEDVHGLERKPEQYDKIIYLMPPPNHIGLWIKRAWAWFAGGVVDLSDPKGVNKKYAIVNIPIIIKIVLENILFRKKWVISDLEIIKNKFQDKVIIAQNVMEGFEEAIRFIRRDTI